VQYELVWVCPHTNTTIELLKWDDTGICIGGIPKKNEFEDSNRSFKQIHQTVKEELGLFRMS